MPGIPRGKREAKCTRRKELPSEKVRDAKEYITRVYDSKRGMKINPGDKGEKGEIKFDK